MHEAQRLKYLKIPARVDDHVRAAGFHLLKGNRLSCLVGKARSRSRIGKQVIEAVAEHDRQQIEDYLTVTGAGEFLQKPAAARSLLVILLDLRPLRGPA